MSDTSNERYRTPESVDHSYEAMKKRLLELQPSLKNLMASAVELFDDVYPQAPHPSVDSSVAFATATLNVCPVEKIPMGRELTVILGAGQWLRVFRHTETSPTSYPTERLWYWQPTEDAHMRVNVLSIRDKRRRNYPYEIEVADFTDRGEIIGFVGGADYHGKESFISEASEAIETAKQVARDHGLLVPQ